jgi:hypothetical protein
LQRHDEFAVGPSSLGLGRREIHEQPFPAIFRFGVSK